MNEINTTLAKEIKKLDKQIQNHMRKAEKNIAMAQDKAILIGSYMEEIKKSRRSMWGEQYLSEIWGRVKNYLAIANTSKKRTCTIDRRFFLLMGMLKTKKKDINNRKKHAAPKWMVWASKLNSFVEDMRHSSRRGDITADELSAIADQCKPIGELYKEASSRNLGDS